MNLIDYIELTLLIITVLVLAIALMGKETESDVCKTCKADKGYCIQCSNYPTNRSIADTIKILWKKIKKPAC